MRACILLFSALLLSGACRTQRPFTTPDQPLALTPAERDTAAALAHFAAGSFFEQDRGSHSLEAIREYELASEYDPDRHRIHSKIAAGYLMRRQPTRAIAALEVSRQRNPDQIEPLVDLAVTCQIAGQLDDALACLDEAIELAPAERTLYATAAKIHIHRDHDAKAVAILRRGFRATGDTSLLDLCTIRSRQLIGKQDLQGALRYLLLLRDETGDRATADLLNLIGQIHLETQHPEKAAAAFREATARPEPPIDSFTKLGATLGFLERADEAVTVLERGRRRHPDNSRIFYSLALAYNAAGRRMEAFHTLNSIKAMTDADDTKNLACAFYLTYGATAERVGRTLAAENAFQTCVELYPDTAPALNYLAYLWAGSNANLDQAMTYVQRALEIEPDNAAYIDTLAWVYYRKGRYEAARDTLLQALERMPDDPILNEHMGDIYDALDAPDEAGHYWTRSLMQDPDSRSAAWKLDALGVDVDPIIRRARKALKRKQKREP